MRLADALGAKILDRWDGIWLPCSVVTPLVTHLEWNWEKLADSLWDRRKTVP